MGIKNNKKKLDQSLRLIAKTSVLVFMGIVLSKFFIYLYRIIIARYFGPEVYGLFSLAFMITGWFVACSAFGLSSGILRYVAIYRSKKQFEKIRAILNKTLIILTISSLISAAFLFISADFISLVIFHNSSLAIFLKIFAFIIPIWIFSELFLAIIRAYERIGVYSFIFNIVQSFAKLILLVLLILFGIKSNAIIFSFALGTLIMFIISYLYCKYKLSEVFGKTALNKESADSAFKEVFSYSWPVMAFVIISNIFFWTDSFFLGFFKGVTEVGFYNAAVPIAAILTISSDIFIQIFFPLITKQFSLNKMGLIKDLSKQVGKWIWIINLPIFIMLILFPGVFINFLFGPQYLVAENTLRLLAIGVFILSLFSVSNNLLSMLGKSKLILLDIIIALIANIILNILLIPRPSIFFIDNSLGIIGASLATIISISIMSILLMFQANYYLSIIPIKRKMLGIFIIVVILAVGLFFIKKYIVINLLNMILLGLLFMLFYLFLIMITKCFDENDLMIIRAIKEKIFQTKK